MDWTRAFSNEDMEKQWNWGSLWGQKQVLANGLDEGREEKQETKPRSGAQTTRQIGKV